MIVVDNVYRTHEYDIRQILLGWIQIRLVEKRNWYLRDLVSKTQKYNILEGKEFMLHPKNIDKTLGIYKTSKRSEIVQKLMEAYPKRVSSSQANYMKDAHMYEITIDEYEATIKEMEDLDKKIKELKIIVSDPENIKNEIANDIKQIKAKFGNPRRSKIINLDNTERNSVGVVQILTDGSVVFSETENPDHLSSDVTPVSGDQVCLIDDTAQFLWVNTNKVPQGKPVTMTSIGKTVMGRCISVVSNMSNNILILTNRGRVKYMPVDRIPSNASKKPLIPLEAGEVVVSVLELRDESEDVLIYTSDGMGKRVKTSELNKVLSVDSIGQFLIKDVNNVSGMFCVNNKKPLLLYVTVLGRTRVNKASLLKEGKKFGEMKSIIKLSPQDDLIAVYCVDPSQTVVLQHADSRVSTINISSLPVSTMSTPPTREKHVPGVKVVRAVIS
jgi:DNA gyrase subunit A